MSNRDTSVMAKARRSQNQSLGAIIGSVLLLVICSLLVFNGLNWFLYGPAMTLESVAQPLGVTSTAFAELYPQIVVHITLSARLVAVWFIAFGALAFFVFWEGYRRRFQRAWYASWFLCFTLSAMGILEIKSLFGSALLVLAVLTIIGGFLARTGSLQ